jgi:hypothetical protein
MYIFNEFMLNLVYVMKKIKKSFFHIFLTDFDFNLISCSCIDKNLFKFISLKWYIGILPIVSGI